MHRCLLSLVLSLVLAGSVSAQELYGPRISPYTNPGFGGYGLPNNLSPYLNLTRRGDPAVNYYLGVVPERERRQLERELDYAFGSLERDMARRGFSVEDPLNLAPIFRPLPRTGHTTGFMQYGTYYNIPSGTYTGQRR